MAYTAPETSAIPQDYRIYEDDHAFQKQAPSLDTLKYIHLEKPTSGKPIAILFWGKAFKGEYESIVAFSKLSKMYPNVQFLGISIDAQESEAEKFVTKLGTAMPEQNITLLEADFPLAFDTDKVVKDAFQKIACLSSMPASMLFLIDANNTVVWRERLNSKAYPLNSSLFEGQIQKLEANQPLYSNGKAPVCEDDEEEECCVVADDALDAFADY